MKTAFFLLIFFYSSFVFAKESQQNIIKLQDLVVTESNKTENFFSDYPYSGNVFVLQDIEEHGIDSIQDVSSEIPNFNFLNFGARSFTSILNVRGLTNTAFFNDPAVIFYVDDVPYGSTFSYANRLYSIDSIEIYRGAQGGLFGKNSYAGVLNLRSQKPENQIKAHLAASYARFNSWTTDAYVNGALIEDKLFFTLGGSYAQSDGYLYNSFLNNTPDNEAHLSGRASLIWKPTPFWDISLIVQGEDYQDGNPHITSINSVNPLEIQSGENGKLEQSSNMEALRINYEKEGFQFLSVTSRRDWELNPFLIDGDFTPIPFLIVQNDQRQTQWNQEFRISSKQEDIAWTIGAFASIGKTHYGRIFKILGFPDNILNSKVEDKNFATFANLTYNISSKWRVHTALRFDYIDKKVDRNISTTVNFKKDRDFFHVSPKLSVDYLVNDDFLLYASTGLAFKPGGFSIGAINPELSEFNSESMWANELGFKAQWFEERVWTNLALFYYDIDNYQVERDVTPVDYTIINAEKTTSYGLELEAGIKLMEGLQLETAFGYTHIRFDEFRDPVTHVDLNGNSPPFVPEKNLMIAAEYKHPSGYFARTEWIWTDKIYFDDANNSAFVEDDFAVLNARLGYQNKHFSFYLFGENLTNTQYFSSILPPVRAGTPAKPRTLGIKMGFDF